MAAGGRKDEEEKKQSIRANKISVGSFKCPKYLRLKKVLTRASGSDMSWTQGTDAGTCRIADGPKNAVKSNAY